MFSTPKRPEIDNHTMKLVVGGIALILAFFMSCIAGVPLESISASYHEDGWPRNIFVGLLFANSAFLLAYNGDSRSEMILSKIAALAALGVALFPCRCHSFEETIPRVHAACSAVMFLVLAFFCYKFLKRARRKGHAQAKARIAVYVLCGIAIVIALLVLVLDNLLGDPLRERFSRLTFYSESTALAAFSFSWLTASRFLPLITRADERYSLISGPPPS
jgi:hypothetical protein